VPRPAYVLAPPELTAALTNSAYLAGVNDPRLGAGGVRGGQFGTYNGLHAGRHWSYPNNESFTAGLDPRKCNCERWLGLSAFDAVALRQHQLEVLPPATRDALWRFVECGGSLLVVGPDKGLPEEWARSRSRLAGLTAYYPGFGQCLVAEQADPGKWSPEQWRAVLEGWEQAAQPWGQIRSPNDANSAFPVVEGRGVPVRGLFVAMLVFAALIGPGNVYWLTRKNRRIWLLWTVPVFSLLTCAAVFGFMLLSEGWTGTVRAEGVTVLDEGSQRAVSVGMVGVYSPITPGDGLHFGYDTEVTPQLREDFRYYRGGSGRTIDWTHGQHFASGWVKPLVPAHFAVRSNEKRLERLTVSREADGSLAALNALKARVVKLWLADRAGKIHTAESIAPGQKAVLKASGLQAEGPPGALREAFAGDWLGIERRLTARPEAVLRPGTYLAELDGAPFLDKGLRGARERPGRSVVFGILKEVPADAR
jgi:hypothetical protein